MMDGVYTIFENENCGMMREESGEFEIDRVPILSWTTKLHADRVLNNLTAQELFISISILCLLTKFGGYSSIVVGYLTGFYWHAWIKKLN